MKAAVIIVGVSFAFMVIAGVALAYFGKDWLDKNGPAMKQAGAKATQEATEFAASHEQNECAGQAILRDDCSKKTNPADAFSCVVSSSLFLSRCVARATPSPDLCDGAPTTSFDMLKRASFSKKICAAHGKADESLCLQMMRGLEDYCIKHASTK